MILRALLSLMKNLPPETRTLVYAIIMGTAAIILGAIVVGANSDGNNTLLGVVAIIGGFAIIINAIPLAKEDKDDTSP